MYMANRPKKLNKINPANRAAQQSPLNSGKSSEKDQQNHPSRDGRLGRHAAQPSEKSQQNHP